jgi:tRNA A37 threonylcarbamoyladenosine dehydratase
MSVMEAAGEIPVGYRERFGGVGRLFGGDALARLNAAHVGVIGVGGVGSWAVEGLARSGIGALTLVDLDDVCVTNINRQLPALEGYGCNPKLGTMNSCAPARAAISAQSCSAVPFTTARRNGITARSRNTCSRWGASQASCR